MRSGYSECCTEGKCDGTTESTPFGFCYCDALCHNLNDCCDDISAINCTKEGRSVAFV